MSSPNEGGERALFHASDTSPPSKRVFKLDEGSLSMENPKALSIATSCISWFNKHPNDLDVFVKTLRRQTGVSLRAIDWAVTNFSRRHRLPIYYRGLPLDLNNDYKRHLLIHTKRNFDAFARRARITILLQPGDQTLSTTVGQLNFFRWLLERNIHAKIQELKAEIEADMKGEAGKDGSEEEQRFLIYTGPFRMDF
jgi:hypothetical protein